MRASLAGYSIASAGSTPASEGLVDFLTGDLQARGLNVGVPRDAVGVECHDEHCRALSVLIPDDVTRLSRQRVS